MYLKTTRQHHTTYYSKHPYSLRLRQHRQDPKFFVDMVANRISWWQAYIDSAIKISSIVLASRFRLQSSRAAPSCVCILPTSRRSGFSRHHLVNTARALSVSSPLQDSRTLSSASRRSYLTMGSCRASDFHTLLMDFAMGRNIVTGICCDPEKKGWNYVMINWWINRD